MLNCLFSWKHSNTLSDDSFNFAEHESRRDREENRLWTNGGAYITSKERDILSRKDDNVETMGEFDTGSSSSSVGLAATQII